MSYLRNSAFSHTSPRFALEGVLRGFSSDTRTVGLSSSIIVMYSQRDCEALTAPDSETYGSVGPLGERTIHMVRAPPRGSTQIGRASGLPRLSRFRNFNVHSKETD